MRHLYKDYIATEANRVFTSYFSPSLRRLNSKRDASKPRMRVVSKNKAVAARIASDALSLPDYYSASASNHLKLVQNHGHSPTSTILLIYKRLFDIVFSVIIMITGFPVFVILYLISKFSSPGPAFYKQERVGRDERVFHIYKFRSMYVDAEKFGPQLSRSDDPRITRWGRIIRKTRLDELPQFWNVIKGDMSIVGPRPERQHFIDQIVQHNPDYRKLQRYKPGLTSMGQVHYGYAENVEEMCCRMVYDLDYIQNPNLKSDLKVILKTVKIMVQCKGK